MTRIEWLEKHGYENVVSHLLDYRKYVKCLDEEEDIDGVIMLESNFNESRYYVRDPYGVNNFGEQELTELRKYLDIVKADFEQLVKECEDV